LSVRFKIIVAIKQSNTAKKVTTTDFLISSSWISRLKTRTSFFPLANENSNNKRIANVVVLIPPPTELGDAPINIKKHRTNKVESLKELISIVAKPPFLVELEWKNA